MGNGYIKLHRKLLDNGVVMKDADHLAVWIYLLLMATHKDHETVFGGKPITLHKGQLITGREKISRATGVEPSKVKRIIKLFKTAQQIDQLTTPHGSIISILAWDDYQGSDQQNDQQVTNERPTNDQQVTTIQKGKNGKNGKNIYKDVPAEVKDSFMAWADMRKQIKKPITSEKTVKMALNKLNKLSSDPEEQNEIILQAINGCWTSFYPLKDKPKKIKYYEAEEEPEAEEMPPEVRANIEKMMKGFDYE